MTNSPKISIVVCVYNEEDNVKPMTEQVKSAMQGIDYELIFVDDGSTDDTISRLKDLQFDRMIIVELKKNYGQSSALSAGIDIATGEYIALIDGDLQNDPADIPAMLHKAESEAWDLVAGNRANRKDGMVLRKIPSKIANGLIRKLTGVYIKDYGCTLKIFTSDLAKSISLYGELHRFIPVLASLEGARITQVDVNHRARQFGQSKYGINRTFKVMSDLMLMLFFKKYVQKPMHLFGNLGLFLFLIGAVINVYLLILKIMGNDIWGKPLLILGLILVLMGIQFITIGIVTDIQVRTYYESQNKKPYRVHNVWRN